MAYSWPAKDPDDIRAYGIDWSDDLATGETVVTSDWTIVTTGTLTSGTEGNTGTVTSLWLLGGTVGETYEVRNEIVTSGDQTIGRTVRIKVKAR